MLPAPVTAIVIPPGTLKRKTGKLNPRGMISCVRAHGVRGFITCQPASRYWAFQGIGTGIFVILAAILIALTAIMVTRRDAKRPAHPRMQRPFTASQQP